MNFIKITAILLLMISCSSKTNRTKLHEIFPGVADNNTTINITVPERLDSSSFDYNQMVSDVRYVRLETTPVSLIGKVDKVIPTKSGYVIADYYISGAVFFFDKAGRFLNRVNASASSDALKSIKDITYSREQGRVFVYDIKSSAIFSYSEAGELISESPIRGFYFRRMVYLKDSTFLFYRPFLKKRNIADGFELAIGDLRGRLKSVAFKDTLMQIEDYDYNNNVMGAGSSNFYSPKFSRLIYQIGLDSFNLYPAIELHFPAGNSVMDKATNLISFNDVKQLIASGHYNFDGQVLRAGNLVYVGVYQKGVPLGFFYSTKSGKVAGGNLISRLTPGDTVRVAYYTYPIANTEDEFISLMDPDIILRNEKLFSDAARSAHAFTSVREKGLSGVMELMRQGDNPVLVLHKIKMPV